LGKIQVGISNLFGVKVKKNNFPKVDFEDSHSIRKVELWNGPTPGQFWQPGMVGRSAQVPSTAGPSSGWNFPVLTSSRGKGTKV
jgi:hypothetical protein